MAAQLCIGQLRMDLPQQRQPCFYQAPKCGQHNRNKRLMGQIMKCPAWTYCRYCIYIVF